MKVAEPVIGNPWGENLPFEDFCRAVDLAADRIDILARYTLFRKPPRRLWCDPPKWLPQPSGRRLWWFGIYGNAGLKTKKAGTP